MNASRLAKLNRPRIAGALARAQLFCRIDQALARGPLWISGPAGCGKTTLAATYIESRRRKGPWYRLDEDDAEPASFLHYLHSAIPGASAVSATSVTGSDDIAAVARVMFREFYGHVPAQSLIVFDGYHQIPGESRTHDAFRQAFMELPGDQQLIVISRDPPPAWLSRARVYGQLSVLGWDDLRLSADETFDIVGTHGIDDRAVSDQVHARSNGWVAGVTLLLAHMHHGGTPPKDPSPSTFDFFAGEIFDKEDPPTRHLLLTTSIVAQFTARQAVELSGDDAASRRLSTLAQRGLFLEAVGKDAYRYHDLFREFLMARMRQDWSGPQLRAHMSRAAALMESTGATNEVIRLRLESHEWHLASRTILQNAPALLAQGRTQSIRDWIHRLPNGLVESSPRLLYALGTAQIALSPAVARRTLERAHAGFVVRQDDAGQALVAGAIIESIYFEYDNYLGLECWTDSLILTLQREPRFPSVEAELRVYSSLQIGLTYRQPTHEYLSRCADRIANLISRPLEVNQRVISGGMLLNYYVWFSPEKATDLVRDMQPLLTSGALTTFNQLWWMVSEAHHLHYSGDAAGMADLMRKANALALQIDAKSGTRLLGLMKLVESVGGGDVASAGIQLHELRSSLDPNRRQEGLTYLALACQHALYRGDWAAALEHGKDAEVAARSTGLINCEYDGLMTQTIAHALVGNLAEASRTLKLARSLGLEDVSRKLRFQSLLVEAFIDARNITGESYGNQTGTTRDGHGDHHRLRQALVLGREQGYSRTFLWAPTLMSSLLETALEQGIEAEYAQRIISRRGLAPTRFDIENWPWPVRIRTLGSFMILKDGVPITFTRKAQQRPLDLLQAILARPNLEASADSLAEELWPDAEGDAAAKALSMALHRLRKLLGHERAVLLIEGKVSLNRTLCWVDAYAFAQSAGDADSIRNREGARIGEFALRLYRGHFLDDEGPSSYPLAARERLRRQWHRLVANLATWHTDQGCYPAAKRIYEQATEIDPGSEPLHRRLIKLHLRHGEDDEARYAFDRCQSMLHGATGRQASFTLQNCGVDSMA